MGVREKTVAGHDAIAPAARSTIEAVRQSSLPTSPLGRVTRGVVRVVGEVPISGLRSIFRFGSRASFIALVLVPALLVAIYNFFILSDQYASTASFIVRGAQKSALSGLGSLLQSSGFSTSRDESYSVIEFMKSRDGMAFVDKSIPLRPLLEDKSVDVLSRFPGPLSRGSEEDLYHRYKSLVQVSLDSTTGIVTLLIKAYRPQDARAIADRLLEGGEAVVNQINERAQRDAISFTNREVERVRSELIGAQQALTTYRLKTGMVEPKSEATAIADLVKGLVQQKLQIDTQIANLQVASPNSPQLGTLRLTSNSLADQIAATQGKLVGASNSLVSQVSEYERLALNVEFLNKSLVAAQVSLDAARADAAKKQIYLERVVNPSLSDEAQYPNRAFDTFVVATSIFFAYSMLWLVLVNVREHVG